MSSAKLKNDASPSTKGTVYQFCVAVQKCYEMVAGQRVLIEKQGDVTIDDSQQVETKLHSAPLTDNHINFWNTLHNWTQDKFDPTHYKSLILYTTQQFGEYSTIRDWNESTTNKRLKILQAINRQAEERYTEHQKKAICKKEINEKLKEPEVLLLQRKVLDTTRHSKLLKVIDRFVIEAYSPDLSELHSLIKQRNMKGILDRKKDDFLASLIGYITQPQATKGQSWEISFEDFEKKVADLTTLYCQETRVFPRKYFNSAGIPNNQQVNEYRSYIFIKKIQDIEHHVVITEAIRDYLGAVRTINEEFKDYEVPPSRTNNYIAELVEIFVKRHRIASRKCNDIISDSQSFFDEITSDEPREFEGFSRPPIGFRNGLLHTQLDDFDKKLKWRLE
jgi:hypothetical protein